MTEHLQTTKNKKYSILLFSLTVCTRKTDPKEKGFSITSILHSWVCFSFACLFWGILKAWKIIVNVSNQRSAADAHRTILSCRRLHQAVITIVLAMSLTFCSERKLSQQLWGIALTVITNRPMVCIRICSCAMKLMAQSGFMIQLASIPILKRLQNNGRFTKLPKRANGAAFG